MISYIKEIFNFSNWVWKNEKTEILSIFYNEIII